MEDSFFISAIICSAMAVIFAFRGLMGKGVSNWKWWSIAMTLYAIFMVLGFILRG